MSEEHDKQKKHSWLDKLSNILMREPQNRDQLMMVLRDAEERKILSSEMLSMIESVIEVSEMQVREVMVPKSQMVVVEQNSSLEILLPHVIESGHSRFPVVDEVGDFTGILLAKDLLKYFFKKTDSVFNIKDMLRAAVFIPESKRLNVLLKEFRINRNHMAIVIDEYGYVSGLVTIEDVLEQIVGEIEDEYDIDEEDAIKVHSDDTYTVKASISIEDFNKYFKTKFKDQGLSTIGDLVLDAFGHLPKRGDKITIGNYQFKVLHSDNRQLYLLEVVKI